MSKNILVAGATGNLGNKICRELLKKGALVEAMVRASTDEEKIKNLEDMGVSVHRVDMDNMQDIAKACTDKEVVLSVVAGLRDVVVDLQKKILEAALHVGVPRFIPSDFCTDYNDLKPGENRNFDLRREFKTILDSTPIKTSSIFNGAFADILKYNTPILNLKEKSIAYWGDNADWKLDFTTMDNTAAFTAEVALDDDAPRNIQIASFQISPNELKKVAEEASGKEFNLQQLSSMEDFAQYIKKQRAENPSGENELYAKWQQSQYMYSMFSTHHQQLANERYNNINWTTGLDFIKSFVK